MSNYSAAKGGSGATTYKSYDDGEGYEAFGADDNAQPGENGFVVVQTVEPVQETVLDLGLFIRG